MGWMDRKPSLFSSIFACMCVCVCAFLVYLVACLSAWLALRLCQACGVEEVGVLVRWKRAKVTRQQKGKR